MTSESEHSASWYASMILMRELQDRCLAQGKTQHFAQLGYKWADAMQTVEAKGFCHLLVMKCAMELVTSSCHSSSLGAELKSQG